MIVNGKPPVVIRSKKFKSYNAGVDMSSMHIIYDILRNKLYKNPIGSIGREIASNCRDVHRVIKQTRRFEIQIVKENDSLFIMNGNQIIFRDYGTGLSPDTIENIYMLYGATTKRDSNDLTGGFGLGAKTPFSYTDSFIVHTICDEIEYIYSIYIDETKEGRADLLMEDFAFGKENMTEVVVPILKGEDIDTFEKGIMIATAFWKEEEVPTFIGFTRPRFQFREKKFANQLPKKLDYHIYLNDDYKPFFETNVSAIIDGIYYPVDTALLGMLNGNLKLSVCLPFENGELTVSASRESLQYDDATVEIIRNRIKEVLLELSEQYDTNINLLPDYFTACRQYKYLKDNDELFKLIIQGIKIEYKGLELTIPKIVMANYEIWKVKNATRMNTFRVEKESLTDLFSVANMSDRFYLLTVEDQLNDEKFKSSRNRTILATQGDFIFIKELTPEAFRAKHPYPSIPFLQEKATSKELLENFQVPLKSYTAVPETKIPPKKKVKGGSLKDKDYTEMSVRIYQNGEFERSDVKTIDGWIVNGKKDKLKDYVYIYTETEKGLPDNYKENFLAISKMVYYISKKVKVLHLTAAKKKHIYKYITLEKWLELNSKTIRLMQSKKHNDNLLNTANSIISTRPVPQSIKDEMQALVDKYKKVYELSWDSPVERIKREYPKINLRHNNYDSDFKPVTKFLVDYPLFNLMHGYRNEYVNMQNELNEKRQKNIELEAQLQEYIAKFGVLK